MTLDTSLIIGPPRRGYSQYIVLGPRAREGAHKNDVKNVHSTVPTYFYGYYFTHLLPPNSNAINVFIVVLFLTDAKEAAHKMSCTEYF